MRASCACSGLNPVRAHRALTERVGYLSQRFSLYGDLTIDENIAFFAEVHGVRDYRARRDQLLSMTQLTPFRTRLADRLSGGMKQKLALACTLVHEPDLILLDEPTTGVDPVSRREFWKLLSEFLANGITILMSTPYLDEAEALHACGARARRAGSCGRRTGASASTHSGPHARNPGPRRRGRRFPCVGCRVSTTRRYSANAFTSHWTMTRRSARSASWPHCAQRRSLMQRCVRSSPLSKMCSSPGFRAPAFAAARRGGQGEPQCVIVDCRSCCSLPSAAWPRVPRRRTSPCCV
jgi:hypothetical protein